MENRNSVIVTSIRQLLGVGVYNDIARGTRAGVQLPELKEVYDQILVTLDPKKSDELWRKWGDMAFDRYVNMPMFWIPAEIIVDPGVVRDYVFPGSISGTYTHFEYIKATPK
jgi:ABC-type transport system substrate-binding protein